MYVVDRKTMLAAERLTDENGTSLYTLMLNAGNCAADFVCKNATFYYKQF